MYTLDQVRCFVAVAETLHFGRAAEELRMTQPPLSRQIQKLERYVGTELLQRDHRRVRLTSAGELFLVESRKLLAIAERAPEGARRVAAGAQGSIAVGFTAASGISLLGPLLSRIELGAPEISIDLAEMVTADQLHALEEERIDLGIGRIGTCPPGLAKRLLHSERLAVALPAESPLAAPGREVRRSDIAGLPLIMHSPTQARYFYDLAVKHIDIDHSLVKHSLSQVVTMMNLVAAGHGIALVPESLGHIEIDGAVVRTFVDLPEEVVELHLLWNPENLGPALEAVLALVDDDGLLAD